MPKWRPWWLIAALILLVASPAAAQTPPIAFADPLPAVAQWPDPLKATVLNNTTQTLMLTLQVADFEDPATGATYPADELLQPLAPAITIPPAGQADLTFAVNPALSPTPGELVGALVLSVPAHNAVLRKPLHLVMAARPDPTGSAVPALMPAVESWTLNAVRVLPFVRPLCLRGPLAGCTLPLRRADAAIDAAYTVGYLTNEAGGGLIATLVEADAQEGARLHLAFDRPWGYTGVYTGRVNLTGGPVAPNAETPTTTATDVTVHVKDIFVWPLAVLWLGIVLARRAQHALTVRKETRALLDRLGQAELDFAKLRKSIHGYTITEDFQQQRDMLEDKIRQWDRTHYGAPTHEERRRIESEILAPLAALEARINVWSQFREKLDRLGRRLLHNAQPAIRAAEPPAGVELEEPRFYTDARLLLRGAKLQTSQIVDMAQRIDHAAELAGKWDELHHMAILVKDAIRELNRSEVELSPSEAEMLEAARHHLNSAARDLWEARDLPDLQRREAEAELLAAQELTRRMLDPFVYYAGAEDTPSEESGPRDKPEAYAAEPDQQTSPMVRTYTQMDAYRLPRLDVRAPRKPEATMETAQVAGAPRLFSERTVTATALISALLLGLNRYVTTDFGATADYLALFSAGLGVKAGLEVGNALLSRAIALRTRSPE